MPAHSPPPTPDSSLTSLISNTVILRCQEEGLYQPLGDYCKGPRGQREGRYLLYHLLSISQPSCCLQLVPVGACSPSPFQNRYGWKPVLLPEVSSRRSFLPQPGRMGCDTWDSYTSFLASKKLLRCRICQTPMATRMRVCRMDHHSTRWLVLSLVCRKRSSRHRW